jgi:hypothetical protein
MIMDRSPGGVRSPLLFASAVDLKFLQTLQHARRGTSNPPH